MVLLCYGIRMKVIAEFKESCLYLGGIGESITDKRIPGRD